LLSFRKLNISYCLWILSDKTSDIFQKLSSFNCQYLFSSRTIKISCLRILSHSNYGLFQKLSSSICHCLLSYRTFKKQKSFFSCIASHNNSAEWQYSLPMFLDIRQAGRTSWGTVVVKRHVELFKISSFFSVSCSQSIIIFRHDIMLSFLIFLFSLHVTLCTSVLLHYTDLCKYRLVISFTLHTPQ
jgi:hypothetical protein